MTFTINSMRSESEKKQRWHPVRVCVTLMVCCSTLTGCASRNVNPDSARPGLGYVDLYSDGVDPLSWEVEQIKGDTGDAKTIFRQYEPIADTILRLALEPGRYQLRVSFLNHVITEPGIADLAVNSGMITPIRVTLVGAGKTQIDTKAVRAGGTYYGGFGRGTKIRGHEAEMFRVNTEAQDPLPYKPKAQMPYATRPRQG